MREAIAIGGKAEVVLEILQPHGLAEARPEPGIGYRNDDLAVGGLIRLVGCQ